MIDAVGSHRLLSRWGESLGNRKLQMALLAVAVAAESYAGTTLSPLQETIRTSLHLTDNEMAILQGPVMALPMIALAVPLGLIIDRYTRVWLVILFAACDLVGTLIAATGHDFSVLVFARSVVGLTVLAVNPAVFSLLSDLFERTQRGRAMMVLTLAQTIGGAAAFGAAGMLLSAVPPSPGSWRMVLLLLAIPLVPVLFGTLALREPSRKEVVIFRPSPRQAFAGLWQYRGMVVPLITGVVLAQTAMGALFVWTAPVLTREHAISADRVGAIMATVTLVSGIAGPAFGGILADACQRFGGPRRTMAALSACALFATPSGLFAVVHSAIVLSVLVVIFTTMALACAVIGNTILTVVVPNEVRGLCLGFFAAISTICAVGLAPVLVSQTSAVMGGSGTLGWALAAVCGGTMLMAFIVLITAVHRFPKSDGLIREPAANQQRPEKNSDRG